MKSRSSNRRKNNISHYWQSFADMMAALLLIFVLVLASIILQLQEAYEKLSADAIQAQTEASIAIGELEKRGEELEKILGIRQSLIEALSKEFKEDELRIDPQTGALVFKTDLMFDFKETTLKKSYQNKLRVFIKKYVDILLSDEFAPHIAEIIIEGHTDSVGTYEDNLWFSQQRALNVALLILSEEEGIFAGDELEHLKQITTINGRSFSERIMINGKEDAEASRRVEIQFRLKDEEMIQTMIDVISGEG